MKSYYLYRITNLINSKCYFGITGYPKAREYQHLRKPKIASRLLSAAVEKYGVDNFIFEILVEGNLHYISELESKAISVFSSISPNGYNIKPGGSTGLAGYIIENRIDDKPVYVSGFWFNSLRQASKTLSISISTLRKRLNRGTIGDVVKPDIIRARSDDVPIYVEGFWFPSKRHAKYFLCRNGEGIKRKGDVGEIMPKFGTEAYRIKRSERMLGKNSGENNGMHKNNRLNNA